MTVAEFKKKWLRYKGKETSAYQEHFNDLCGILGQKTPADADPSGSDWFCFQKRVVKDMEMFAVEESGAEAEESQRGFADVWRKGCFAWEYKGKRKNLDEAHKQLLRYRESLLNPPLLVVCDFERFIIRTNFNGTVQETYDFNLDQMDQPKNWRVLRALFVDPDSLKPTRTTAEVTEGHRAAIAAAAKELNDLRERWLNPPEWTETRFLEFPGSVNGPWARFIDPKTVNAKTNVGTVRYPRLEPRDAECAATLKKRTLTNLYNERPAWLDLAHRKLDAAVAAAYGWPADLSDEQILEKLLALNLERAAAEAQAAAMPKKAKPQRDKHADELI